MLRRLAPFSAASFRLLAALWSAFYFALAEDELRARRLTIGSRSLPSSRSAAMPSPSMLSGRRAAVLSLVALLVGVQPSVHDSDGILKMVGAADRA